jgi:hypothetical protein
MTMKTQQTNFEPLPARAGSGKPAWAAQCRQCRNLKATKKGQHLRCRALVLQEYPLKIGWVADARKLGGICGPDGVKFQSQNA